MAVEYLRQTLFHQSWEIRVQLQHLESVLLLRRHTTKIPY